mgnify:CR=1 FL=1
MKEMIVISFALVLILFGCVSEAEKKHEALEGYLEQTFDISIPAEKHYYLLLSESGCRGCRDIAADIDEDDGYTNNVTVIYFVGEKRSDVRAEQGQDKQIATIASLHNFGLRYIGTALVETENGAVQEVRHIDANNLDEMLRKIIRK